MCMLSENDEMKVTVEQSPVYVSGHLYPVDSDDKPMYLVRRDGKTVESFYSEEAATEFATILRKTISPKPPKLEVWAIRETEGAQCSIDQPTIADQREFINQWPLALRRLV